MRWVEIKEGAKVKLKLVDDNYTPEGYEIPTKDLTTSGANLIGYSDIDKDRWDSIFKGANNGKRAESYSNS